MLNVNINTKSAKIHLAPISYYIDMVGGFSVELNGFTMRFTEVNTGTVIIPRVSNWPVRSIQNGKRSTRIFIIDALKKGEYLIEFENSNKPVVKRSYNRPFPFSFMPNPSVPNELLYIKIQRVH